MPEPEGGGRARRAPRGNRAEGPRQDAERRRQDGPDRPRADQRVDRSRSGGAAKRGQDGTRGGPRPTAAGVGPGRTPGPPIPDDVTGRELDPAVRRELAGLSPERAQAVAQHLVMAGWLIDSDPHEAYEHARAARQLAARLAVVREAIALAAYHIGRYDEALAEFRALRRISGGMEYWPVMADCERGLGRPERALRMAGAPEVATLDPGSRVEMRIVAAGARRDLGQLDAAIVTLQVPELDGPASPWVARLRYAYADALGAAGRPDEARRWFARAAQADTEGETGAVERLAELDGVTFVD